MHSADLGQANHVEDIFFRLGATDDVLANCLCGISAFQFGDDTKCGKQFAALRGESFGQILKRVVSLFGGFDFRQNLRVDAGVLANVESVQAESEGVKLAQKWVDEALCQVL